MICYGNIGDLGFGYSFALSPDIAGQYEWTWSIFFNACYVFMAAAGIWYYLVSRRNNILEPRSETVKTYV